MLATLPFATGGGYFGPNTYLVILIKYKKYIFAFIITLFLISPFNFSFTMNKEKLNQVNNFNLHEHLLKSQFCTKYML